MTNKTVISEYGDNAQSIRIGVSWDAKKLKDQTAPHKSKAAKTTNLLTIIILPISMFIRFILFILAGFLWLITFGKFNVLPKSILFPTTPDKSALLDEDVILETDASRAEDESGIEYNIDLYCYAVNKSDGTLVKIGPENKNLVSPNEFIFHSGDEKTGQGIYDDEDIYIKLKEAQDIYSSFYIVVNSNNNHSLSNLENAPQIRILKSKEEQELVKIDVPINDNNAKDHHCYIYAKIHINEGSWELQHINKFTDFDESLEKTLKTY